MPASIPLSVPGLSCRTQVAALVSIQIDACLAGVLIHDGPHECLAHAPHAPHPCLCSMVVGFGVGLLVARLTRTPPELRSIVMCAVAFSNVGELSCVQLLSATWLSGCAVAFRNVGERAVQQEEAFVDSLFIPSLMCFTTLWGTVAVLARPCKHRGARCARCAWRGMPGRLAAGRVLCPADAPGHQCAPHRCTTLPPAFRPLCHSCRQPSVS